MDLLFSGWFLSFLLYAVVADGKCFHHYYASYCADYRRIDRLPRSAISLPVAGLNSRHNQAEEAKAEIRRQKDTAKNSLWAMATVTKNGSRLTEKGRECLPSAEKTGKLFLGIFVFSLAVRLLCYTGLVGSDDVHYSFYAQQIAVGTYELEPHHMAIRYGLLLPVAALYKIFGAQEWTTVAVPILFSSLAPALAAILAFQLSELKAAWIAGLLLASFPVELRYGSILVPEPILQVPMLLGAIVFVIAMNRQSLWLALLAGFILGLAYLVKEPGAFVVVAFCLFALIRGEWRIGAALAAGAFVIPLGEIAWFWSQSGDLLFRSTAMAGHNKTGMAVAANELLSYRLLKSYPRMMILPNIDFGLHSVFALAVAGLAVLRYRSPGTALLCLWAALPWLYLNFGSSSFAYFWALPVAPRYIAIVYTPLFVLTGIIIARWPTRVAVGVLAFVLVVGVGSAYSTRRTGYRTAEMAELKAAANYARANGHRVVRFESVRMPAIVRQRALMLIAPDLEG